jgi:hypothetical protein
MSPRRGPAAGQGRPPGYRGGRGAGRAGARRQVYFHCGYLIVYGQMPPRPSLDAFYRRNGFQVLSKGEGLDLWVIFGVHSRIDTDHGERFFIRYAQR